MDLAVATADAPRLVSTANRTPHHFSTSASQ